MIVRRQLEWFSGSLGITSVLAGAVGDAVLLFENRSFNAAIELSRNSTIAMTIKIAVTAMMTATIVISLNNESRSSSKASFTFLPPSITM